MVGIYQWKEYESRNNQEENNMEDEEGFLIDQAIDARGNAETLKQVVQLRKMDMSQAEKHMRDTEEALADYMKGNKLSKLENNYYSITLGETYNLEIERK